MEQETKKINRSIKIYPLFASFTGDLIFFVPIDTLFLTLVKGLNASQITAMTMVALIICIVFQKVILAIVKKIGNVNSLRLGATMLLIASLVLTFGKSFIAMLLYKSIHELAVMFLTAFLYYESKINNEQEIKKEHKKLKITSIIFYIILSNAVFYSIIKMGQNNSKLFMQYDFQKFLSVEMVTYYITTIVFISRIARLVGNVIFGKVYSKIKDKMSIVLTICLALAFLLLIIGHFIESAFICKVIIMSLGFFLILAIRDSFQTYIEDVALTISNKEEQQEIIIKIEVYRRLGTLILSAIFTLILMKYELIVIEFILLSLSIIEIFINKSLCNKLSNYSSNNR